MAHDAPATSPSGKVVISNIGLLLSGDIAEPILDADTIVVSDGRIAGVGRFEDLDTEGARTRIDAHGSGLAPGLIDSHVHPVAGDWTPRQSQLNWIDSTLHGGVTTMISAGEVHTPGRPRDIVGLKAMAIYAQRCFTAFRPGGMKIHAGAPVIEPGMVEDDFKELAAAGVTLLGEVGKDAAVFGHIAEPAPHDGVGRLPRHVPAGEGHAAVPAAQEPGDGLERRRLARAVAPEQRDGLPRTDLEIEPEQDLRGAVPAAQVGDGQDHVGAPLACRAWRRPSPR